MMPDTALAAVMQAWVPRFPAWSAASTWETWGGGGVGESHGDCGRCRVKEKGHWCLGEGTEERAGNAGRGWDRLQGWGASPLVHREEHSHLLGDSPGTLYELLLGVGVTGAALQGACFGDQSRTAVPQLLYPVLDVGTYL